MVGIYKVLFSYKEDSPSGRGMRFSEFKTEFRIYAAEDEKELQGKVNKFLSDNKCGRRKQIIVRGITKM